jgi:hypothetical protein
MDFNSLNSLLVCGYRDLKSTDRAKSAHLFGAI